MINFDKKNDLVEIVAPASRKWGSELVVEAGGDSKIAEKLSMEKSLEELDSILTHYTQEDFNCIYNEKIFLLGNLPYFAAPLEDRINSMKAALLNPDVKIISAYRGGYGTFEVAHALMDVKPEGPKILIGFSDITAMHSLFNQVYSLPSIHGGAMITWFHNMPMIFDVLNGKDQEFALTSLNSLAKEQGMEVEAEITGGNLSVMCSMIGTSLELNLENKILLIEDIFENGYQIHRNLLNLYHSHAFEGCKGVIFGDFTLTDDMCLPTIQEFTNRYLSNIPVYKVENIGHGADNFPFVLGAKAKIAESKLTVTSPFRIK